MSFLFVRMTFDGIALTMLFLADEYYKAIRSSSSGN